MREIGEKLKKKLNWIIFQIADSIIKKVFFTESNIIIMIISQFFKEIYFGNNFY